MSSVWAMAVIVIAELTRSEYVLQQIPSTVGHSVTSWFSGASRYSNTSHCLN
jgi:hypothetical protein